MLKWLFLATFLFASTVLAASFVETPTGVLDDDAFFNVVVCGVPPGQACSDGAKAWPADRAKDLRVRVIELNPQPTYRKHVNDAIDSAIAEINRSGANLALRRVESRGRVEADISIYISDFQQGQRISDTGSDLDGSEIEGAAVNIAWDDAQKLERAVIVIASDLEANELPSILLEELAQSLGPINDIRNPAYESQSIFSEDSNSRTALGNQDIMVLKRLYP